MSGVQSWGVLQAGFLSMEPRAAEKESLPLRVRCLPRASITGTVRTRTCRLGSLLWFILAGLVSFCFFGVSSLLFARAWVDGDSLVRHGPLGSTGRKASISAPALREGGFLSEVVRKEGFEVFEYLLLSVLSKRFVCPHLYYLSKLATRQNIFWLVLPKCGFYFWGEEKFTPWLNCTEVQMAVF